MFKKLILLSAFMLFAIGSVYAADETEAASNSWKIDGAHSSIGFSVRHLVISKVKGGFNDFSGSVTFDGENLSAGSVEFTVKVASIDTDNEDRDKHLSSPDFFDVEKYADMTFKSKSVVVSEDGFMLVGDLTIKDVTNEVTFNCEFNGTVVDPWGNTRAGFSAVTKINRQDFNITWSKALETGGLVVSDEVTIQLELEIIKD